MSIEFTNPLALVLLVLLPATLYVARHGLANLSPARGRASTAIRLLILLLVVFALSGLRVRTATRDLALIFLVDVSASVAQGEQQKVLDLINREIDRAAPRDYIGVIAFGSVPSVELAPTRKEILGDKRLNEISSSPPRDYTNIAGALRLATALIPEAAVGRVVLISDGNENLEAALDEAQLLKADRVQVYTRALNTTGERGALQGEVAVRDLVAPEMLAEGEAFDLKVTLDSTRDTTATLRIFRNDTLVAERDVEITASGENSFLLPQRVEQKGFYTYRAEIEAIQADGFVQNNSRATFAIVEGRPKTLYVHGDSQASLALSRVLVEGSFAPDIRAANGVPTTLAGFQNYDLVIFDNVPALALTTEQMKMLQAYVRDLGGGFVMIGGDQSFGPGGYYKTIVEQVLPVSLDVRQKKHFPSLALALVLDKSGSMEGDKMKLAAEAGSAAVDFLSERDSVGVIAFDSEASAVVNMVKVEDKRAITRAINAIQASGGTNMYPGLRMAYEWLLASDAQIKHVIVLSDGQSEAGDFPGIAKAITDAGMTLTAVAVGSDAAFEMMQELAERGGGRFYATDNPDNLPRIFTREASLASRSTIIEEPFVPRLVRPAQATAGIDWGAAPPLGGYVGTAERDPLKTAAITSLLSDKDDPVYAVWQYGLGRAAAFTSDAKAQWAAGWMSWPGFGQFWTQVLRDTLRREAAGDLLPRVEINAGRGHVTVEAITPEGEFKNNLRLRAQVVAPDYSVSDIQLEQTAAGRYEGDFAAVARGAYLVNVTEEGGQPAPIAGSVNSYSPEFSITASDTNLLARISEATAGQALIDDASGNSLFDRQATKTIGHEVWQSLMLVALLLLPADVGIRRLHFTREQVAHSKQWLRSRLARRATAIETETAPGLAQLKDARARVRLAEANLTPVEANDSLMKDDTQQAFPAAGPLEAEKVSTAEAAHKMDSKSARPAAETQPLASRLLDVRRKRSD